MTSSTRRSALARPSSPTRRIPAVLTRKIHQYPYLAVAAGAGLGFSVALGLRVVRVGRLFEVLAGLAMVPSLVGLLDRSRPVQHAGRNP